MKIIQFLARIDGSGVTTYIRELNKGLQKTGYDVEMVVVKTGFKDADGYSAASTQTLDNVIEYEFGDDLTNKLNSADLVIVNSIIDRRAPTRDTWIDLLINKVTTKKVIIVNDHKPAGFRAYYGDLLKNKDFWMSFDKICTFQYTAKVYQDIIKTIGEEQAKTRYMHLLLPYEFNNNIKNNWLKPSEKLRRVTYLGRHAPFKDNHRLVRACDNFWAHDYELEMRGVKATINMSTTPNLKYEFDENNEVVFETEGPRAGLRKYSKICRLITNKWRKNNGIALTDNMVDTPRDKNIIYLFDAYKREEGLENLSHSAFGCDFFNLDSGCYGDDFEYTIFEMIEQGSIVLFDYAAGSEIHLYDANGIRDNQSVVDKNLGIFLKKDCSNIENVLSQMDVLMNSTEQYNDMRNKVYDAYAVHCDPIMITKKFMTDIFKNNI